jgi:hypothetical protein
MKLLSAKKGNVIDLMTSPLFITIVALGIVGLTILNATTKIGSDTTYEQKYYSADAALLIDSLYSVRKDANLHYIYLTPENIGFKIEPHTVTAYTKKDPKGNKFYYTQDTKYVNVPANFDPGKSLIFYRVGNEIGAKEKISEIPKNEPVIICEENLPLINANLADKTQLKTEQIVKLAGPTPLILSEIKKGPSQLIIYTNNKEYANNLACHFSKTLRENKIKFEGYSIVPITPILAFNDATKEITSSKSPAIYIQLQQPELLPGLELVFYDAIQKVVTPGGST